MTALALLFWLAAAEPTRLELRGPDRIGESPAGGAPPVLYTGQPEKPERSLFDDHRLYFVAGGVLIIIAIILTTRARKRPAESEEPPP